MSAKTHLALHTSPKLQDCSASVLMLAANLSVDDADLPKYPETPEQAHARASKALEVSVHIGGTSNGSFYISANGVTVRLYAGHSQPI